ncbi:MAG: glutamyl-tRNA reductase [Eubacteriales bacterium]|nr:glutamyl-tRNA reductase [Eubacteriales bacterium]
MNICMLGVDYREVTMDRRQPFYITGHQATDYGKQWMEQLPITGCVILSTCNRTEIWIETEKAPKQMAEAVLALLCRHKELPPERLGALWQYRTGETAIRHLMEVAAGLRSQVLGDDQILTQLKTALTQARHAHTAGVGLELLFRSAIRFGKEIKTAGLISHQDSSVVAVGLSFISRKGFDLKNKKILVIGNGEMGYLACTHCLEAGADVWVTVRQYRKGMVKLAKGAHVIEYDNRYSLIPQCDLIISATASPNLTITAERLREALDRQVAEGQQSLVKYQSPVKCQTAGAGERLFLDLALPRDIDPAIDGMTGVARYDLDDFGSGAKSLRQTYLAMLEPQLAAAVEDCLADYRSGNVAGQILELRDHIYQDISRRFDGQWKSGGEQQQAEIQTVLQKSVSKAMEKLLFSLQKRYKEDDFKLLMKTMRAIYHENEDPAHR